MRETASQKPDGASKRTRLLFSAIGFAATAVAVVLTALRLTEIVTIEVDLATRPLMAYGLAALSLALIGIAYAVLKPRVPTRVLGQTADEFWTDQQAASNSLLFWALLEAASLAATVGYFLTGVTAMAPAIVVALAVYWISGPSTFDRA